MNSISKRTLNMMDQSMLNFAMDTAKLSFPIGMVLEDVRFPKQVMKVTGHTSDRYGHALLKVHSISGHNTTTVSPKNVKQYK